MSDTSQGEGWWQASDEKWYPPETRPGLPQNQMPAPPQPAPSEGGLGRTWSIDDLHVELARFEGELKAAGVSPSSVQSYVDGSARFLRWLLNEYQPRDGG